MLPDVGATEYLVIAIVALIVVGPKDLPILLRKLGKFMAKLRGMANEFRASFDEMARQSELDELRAEVEAMRKGQLADIAAREAGHADATNLMREIDEGLRLENVTFPPNLSADDAVSPAPVEPPPERATKPRAARKPAAAAKPKAGAAGASPKRAKPPSVVAKTPPAAKPARKPRAPKSGDAA